MTAPLIYSNVCKSFGGLRAIDDLSLRFEAGRIYSVIGPNGAGKSTAINLSSGAYRATSGSIRLGEVELSTLPKYQIARLGVARTYQDIRLFDEMTVAENLEVTWAARDGCSIWREVLSSAFRDRRKRDRRVVINRVLSELELQHQADTRAASLSYGEQKRLEIARALVMDPQVLMLDEPAAGLNEAESKRIEQLILDLRRPGRVVIVVEHDMKLVMSVSDWIFVLHQGRLLKEGMPQDIRNDATVQEAYLGSSADNERFRATAMRVPTRVRVRSEADIVRH